MRRLGARLGAIALIAMLVRGVLPAGYMLAEAQSADGRYLTVQMCIGHGARTTTVIDLNTGQLVDPLQSGTSGPGDPRPAPCVFAAASAIATPTALAEPVEFLLARKADFAMVRDVRPGRGIPAPPPPSTGPPSLI